MQGACSSCADVCDSQPPTVAGSCPEDIVGISDVATRFLYKTAGTKKKAKNLLKQQIYLNNC